MPTFNNKSNIFVHPYGEIISRSLPTCDAHNAEDCSRMLRKFSVRYLLPAYIWCDATWNLVQDAYLYLMWWEVADGTEIRKMLLRVSLCLLLLIAQNSGFHFALNETDLTVPINQSRVGQQNCFSLPMRMMSASTGHSYTHSQSLHEMIGNRSISTSLICIREGKKPLQKQHKSSWKHLQLRLPFGVVGIRSFFSLLTS